MDLMSLKYFQFVAMYRNFSKAAEHFYIGQSALSRQIANLEKELGVQLFVRDTRNVNLTDAGTVLYQHCDLLLRHHELVFRLLDASRSGHSGHLGIATVTNFGVAFSDLVDRFIHTYPDVKTTIDDIPFNELSDSILHGIYDLAFTLDFEVPQNDQIAQVTIGQDHFVAVMHKDYPFRGHRTDDRGGPARPAADHARSCRSPHPSAAASRVQEPPGLGWEPGVRHQHPDGDAPRRPGDGRHPASRAHPEHLLRQFADQVLRARRRWTRSSTWWRSTGRTTSSRPC